MASKLLVFLGIFLALALLISSEVAARDLDETSNPIDASNEGAVEEAQYGGGGGGYPGGGGGGYPGRGGGGGGYPGRGGGGGGYPGRGGGGGRGCRFGCCGRGYNGGCRCCRYPGEKVDAETQAKP